ncbi:MAG: LicD family protein [Rikenellaceae bacterium]|nr:LicD family protein [Rikenellaceae bacterium]
MLCNENKIILNVDYERKYNLKQLHENFLDLMIQFDKYCRKHSIEYSLCGGTRLGGVRHGGFIPWDNDADLEITRSEYNRLRECLEADKPDFEVGVLDLWVERIYRRGQEDGFFIDLFILDNAPDNKLARKIKRWRLLILQGMIRETKSKYSGNPFIRIGLVLTFYLGKLFDRNSLLKHYRKISEESNNKKTKQLATYNTSQWGMYHYDRTLIEAGYQDIEFCGYQLRIFKKCREMLEVQYGNYMELPPEEKRCPTHRQHTD